VLGVAIRFWNGSVAAHMIVAIRERLIGGVDRRTVAVGRDSLVRRAQLQPLELPSLFEGRLPAAPGNAFGS
jgi:hypothetical protein